MSEHGDQPPAIHGPSDEPRGGPPHEPSLRHPRRILSLLSALMVLPALALGCAEQQSTDDEKIPGITNDEGPTATAVQADSVASDLRLQLDARRELAMDLPYNYQQIIGTHNSWNKDVGGYNQVKSITEQLDLGARALYIDTYSWLDNKIFLCHKACEIYTPSGRIWSNNVQIESFFSEVKTWLDAHPREVISFQVEDYSGQLGNGGSFQTLLDQYFGSRWLKQSERSTYFPSWQERLWPTPRQLLAGCEGSGCNGPHSPKQLLVATLREVDGGRLSANDHVKNLFHAHDFGKTGASSILNFQSQAQAISPLYCYKSSYGDLDLYRNFNDGDAPVNLQAGDMIGVEDDKAYTGIAPSQGIICAHGGTQWESGVLAPCVDLYGLVRCDVNMISMDRFAEDLARRSVHTWDTGEPNGGGSENCAAMSAGGYLSDHVCVESHPFFCTTNNGTEGFVSKRSGVWSDGEAVCAAEGGTRAHYRGPMKASQYFQLQQAVSASAPLWVNLSDMGHEGQWSAELNLAGTALSNYSPPLLTAECPSADTTVRLSWTAGANDATSITLERSDHDAGVFSPVSSACVTLSTDAGVTAAGPGTCEDTTMTAGQTYDYRVRAMRGGLTTYSNVAVVIAARPVDNVEALAASVGDGSGTATLSWTIPATNNVDHYEVFRKDGYGWSYALLDGNVSAGARVSYVDTTAPPNNDQLYYSLVAVNNSCRGRVVSEVITPPRAPTNLVATVPTSGQNRVRLTFTDNSYGEDHFRIYRQKDSGESVEIGRSPARAGWGQTQSYEDFPEGDATYTYKVIARHPIYAKDLESAPSNSVSVTLGSVTSALSVSYDHVLSDNQAGERVFRFDPVGTAMYNLRFQIQAQYGSLGDADLYVALNRIPTTTDYDCRPYTTTSTETCVISSPAANYDPYLGYLPYYVMVRGYTNYTNVALSVIENELPPTSSLALTYVPQGAGVLFTWPDQTSVAQVQLSAANSSASGDADLFVACGMAPFIDPASPNSVYPLDYDTASINGSYNESALARPLFLESRPSRCFALVKGYTSFGNVKITSTARGPG